MTLIVYVYIYILDNAPTEYYPWPGALEIPDDGRLFINCEMIL